MDASGAWDCDGIRFTSTLFFFFCREYLPEKDAFRLKISCLFLAGLAVCSEDIINFSAKSPLRLFRRLRVLV